MRVTPSGRIVAIVLSQLLALTGAVGATPAVADSSAESQFVSLLNEERAAAGHPPVDVASDLVSVAREHANRMASSNDLHHNPNLGADVSGWKRVGENVGRGPSVSSIHTAFMNSGSHRANILDPGWIEVGVGVAVVDGRIWVTQVFRTPVVPDPASTSATSDEADVTRSSTTTDGAQPDPSDGHEPSTLPRRAADWSVALTRLGTFLRSATTGSVCFPPGPLRLKPFPL